MKELELKNQHFSEILKEKELRLAEKEQYRKDQEKNFMTLMSDQRKGTLDLVFALQGKSKRSDKKRKRSDSGSASDS